MEPICDGKRTEIDIPIRARGTVDDDRADNSVRVLQRKVTVIPRISVTRCMEGVGEGTARRDRTWKLVRRRSSEDTLRDTGYSVHRTVHVLVQTVPMD